MKILFALFLSLFLTACASNKTTYNPETGVASGMASEDIADVMINKNYTTAVSTPKAARPIFSLQGVEGQVMELKNVKSITVWAPEPTADNAQGLQLPGKRPSGLVQFLDATGNFVQKVGSVLVPMKMFSEQNKTARHQSDNNLEQYRIGTDAWSTTTNNAIAKDPYVYVLPAASAPATPAPTTPVPAE